MRENEKDWLCCAPPVLHSAGPRSGSNRASHPNSSVFLSEKEKSTPVGIGFAALRLSTLGGASLRIEPGFSSHALADVHPKFVECRAFVRCFGGEYEDPESPEEYDRELHVSKYAATMPAEDFAETFHFYIRHKGRLPVRLAGRPAIVRKWNFIERIARAMGLGRTGFR